MLVTNTATPGNGYLGRQNQAKTAASSGAQIESANVSDPSFKEYRGVGFIQPDQQRPGPSYYHDAKDS